MDSLNRKLYRHVALAASAAVPALLAGQNAQRPNILLVVVDDMGYSDMGCFGGEINTPNLDAMANHGVRFAQFYNSGRSCPSRAQLLTGCYPHTCGITAMGRSLTKNCVTVAEVLKGAGYRTAMSGKWHLSLTQSIGSNEQQLLWLSHQNTFNNAPFAPLDTYPCNRGFDDHYGTIWGVANHFDPFSLVHNEEPIYTDAIPDDFYSTDFITDHAIDYIDEFSKSDDPFFLYVAYNAPHWPLHAKPEDIAKYKGKYNEGWEAMRKARYDRMVELGIVNPDETPDAPNESGRSWEAESNKALQAANMEVHAAMIDCVDQGFGRIVEELKAKGLYDNTLILFTSDNGASSENYTIGEFDRHNMTRDGQKVVRNAASPGNELSYNYLDNGWAGAVNAPFRYWKRQSFHGGTATPTIVQWPAGMTVAEGSIVREVCHFIDFMPTCLDISGAEYPVTYKGNDIQTLPAEGRSLLPLLKADGDFNCNRTLYWEHENGRAIRDGNWRLTKHTDGRWQLFNMTNDLSETNNVAEQYPEVVIRLRKKWNNWAAGVGLEASITIDSRKTYSISNRNDNNLYVQDNNTGTVLTMGAFCDNACWRFEPTGKEDCYYIKNVVTGRYAQLCSASTEVNITMGTEPVEYKVLAADGEGINCFGITSTNLTNTNFTNGCIGWNWKGDNTVQTYAATEGTNHRSFWKLSEVDDPSNKDWPLDGRVFTVTNRIRNVGLDSYWVDNGWQDNRIECAPSKNAYAYWTLEKTDNKNCYSVRNTATGRYLQGYKDAETTVTLGNAPVEYAVMRFANEENAYGFSYTGNTPHNFTTAGTLGLNLRKEPNEEGCCVQSFAAVAGTNHRSFWRLAEDTDCNISVGTTLYTTLVAPYDLDMTSNPDVTAFVVSDVKDGYVIITETEKVRGGSAVVIHAESSGTHPVSLTNDVAMADNLLKAARSSITVTESHKQWELSKPTNGDVAFYPIAPGSTIAVARGYLELDVPELARECLNLMDMETDVKGIIMDRLDGSQRIYNISGQRIGTTQKGINIVGDRKVLY